MRNLFIALCLWFAGTHLVFAQTDSTQFQKEQIRKQALELRGKINSYVNQTTSKEDPRDADLNKKEIQLFDSLLKIMTQMQGRILKLESVLDSVSKTTKKQSEQIQKMDMRQNKSEKLHASNPNSEVNAQTKVIYFTSNSYQVAPAFANEIKEWIHAVPIDKPILIEGFTDETGEANYNMDLSLRRANAIALLLKEQGFQNLKIEVKARGESNIEYAGNINTRYQMNRKVVLSFD